MDIDTRPIAKDISLCMNVMCQNKCKRYYENWSAYPIQSFIDPPIEYDKEGKQKPCKIRME